jgi:hypothetical protein
MIPKIFDIENNKLVINEHILSIPELKKVYEKYDDPIPALLFLRNMTDPEGPYNQLDEFDKEDAILYDFPGEYTTEDDEIIAALAKLKSLNTSETYRYYLANKELLDKLSRYATSVDVTDGKNGNLPELIALVKSTGKTIQEYNILKKETERELKKLKARGGEHFSYDELEEDE